MKSINDNKGKDVDLMDTWIIIKSSKSNIFKITGIFVVLSIIYSIFAAEYYQSTTTLYPVNESIKDSFNLGNLQGIAESFGVGSLDSKSTYYIPDIVMSRNLKKNIIHAIWETKQYPRGSNLIKFWELDDTLAFTLSKIFNYSNDVPLEIRQSEDAIQKLERLISVYEEDSGLISIKVLAEERNLASNIANYICNKYKFF